MAIRYHNLSIYDIIRPLFNVVFFFFNDTATTEIYTLSLHDALPIRSPVTMTRMTHPPQSHQADTGDQEVVLGVDTHKDTHVAAVLDPVGALLGSRCFATTVAGYQQLLGWAQTLGRVRRAGVECTGSYGAALTRHLRAAGVQVIEVNQPDKGTRRRRGKTDAIDAEAAARAVLAGRATATAKTGDGPVEMARMFKLAKDSAVKSRTQAINQLKAVLVSADPALRESL